MPYADGCRGCGAPCDGNRCDSCNATRRDQERARREHRRAHGLCLTCGEPVAKTKTVGGKRAREASVYCARHLEYYAARQRV